MKDLIMDVYLNMTQEQKEAAHQVEMARSCVPMTGRYGNVNDLFSEFGSEWALNRNRVKMEIIWLLLMDEKIEELQLTSEELCALFDIMEGFDEFEHLDGVKRFENITKHDVKACEYYIREELKNSGLERIIPYIHIGLTSEDTNNVAYAQMVHDCMRIWYKKAEELVEKMRDIAYKNRKVPMIGHTHGQFATPLTFGLAMAVEWYRLKESLEFMHKLPIDIKVKGAVGNMAALNVAYPEMDTIEVEKDFALKYGRECKFKVRVNPLTSQIESHDYIIRIMDELRHFTNIVKDIGKNHLWEYISRGYLTQETKAGEVGSSTMPNKVNPIDGENAWSIADKLAFEAMGISQKLPFSIMQRDLSDSATMRTIPSMFLLSYQSISRLLRLLKKIKVNEQRMLEDLRENPEVLAEAIQTVLRKNGHQDAYEVMKDMTRGKKVSLESLREFVSGLDIAEEDKKRLLNLRPEDYIGDSIRRVEMYCSPENQ